MFCFNLCVRSFCLLALMRVTHTLSQRNICMPFSECMHIHIYRSEHLSYSASKRYLHSTNTHTFNTFSSKQLNESIQTAAKENNQWKQQQKRKLGIQFSQHTQSLNVNLLNSESLCIWLLSHITNECYIFIVNKFILLLSVRIELCQ